MSLCAGYETGTDTNQVSVLSKECRLKIGTEAIFQPALLCLFAVVRLRRRSRRGWRVELVVMFTP